MNSQGTIIMANAVHQLDVPLIGARGGSNNTTSNMTPEMELEVLELEMLSPIGTTQPRIYATEDEMRLQMKLLGDKLEIER